MGGKMMRVDRAQGRAMLVLAGCFSVAPAAWAQAPEETTLAVPAFSLTFSSSVVAEEGRRWEEEGLKVTISTAPGVAGANTVLAGSAEFTLTNAATLRVGGTPGQHVLA